MSNHELEVDAHSENQNGTYPWVNCEDAMSPGLRPAAAAMAARLALVGSWVAPWKAAERLGAATITCPVPRVAAREDGAWLTAVTISWAEVCSEEGVCAAVGDGLSEGEDAAVVIKGAVEMTEAVLVVAEPIVVPEGRKGSFKDCEENKRKFFKAFLAYQWNRRWWEEKLGLQSL